MPHSHAFINRQKSLFLRVRELKHRETEAEFIFRQHLIAAGIRFMFQKGFIQGNYYCIVDFYLPKPIKTVIEIDGGYHSNPEQIKKDARKDEYLKSRGFKVLRIKNEDVSTFDISTLIHAL